MCRNKPEPYYLNGQLWWKFGSNKTHIMKNKILQLSLVGFFSLFCNPLSAQGRSVIPACMEITGRIMHLSGKQGNTYKAELLNNNIVVDSLIVGNNGSFKFLLPKNCFYAIRISKKGYAPRLISIYTQLLNDGFYKFEFDTELIDEVLAAELDKETMDFPVAIISYDHQMGYFYYNEEYTSNIKRSLFGKDKLAIKAHSISN